MLWSGSSPLAVVRDGMWGLLMFAGVAWLAIGWSVLRLEPTDIVSVAGPVVLFGALTEALRACAGTRTWWLNAGMAVLFAGDRGGAAGRAGFVVHHAGRAGRLVPDGARRGGRRGVDDDPRTRTGSGAC